MGGDVEKPRFEVTSDECADGIRQLNDLVQMAWILKQHMDSTGEAFADL